MTCAPDGEIHTQRDWGDQSGAVLGQLGAINAATENMLACLTVQDAGRSQVEGVKAWADQIGECMTHGEVVVTEVNAHQDPYVGAVQDAGGPGEVANPDYYREM